ncbi:MAG: hypothetical protein D6698_12470, partial [Gammaproteobacteria bacterium]
DTAVKAVQRYVKATGDKEVAMSAIRFLVRENKFDMAQSIVQSLLAHVDDGDDIHRMALLLALKSGDEMKALEQFEWALGDLPKGQKDRVAVEMYELLKQNASPAMTTNIMQKLLENADGDTSVMRLVAEVQARLGAYENAQSTIKHALDLAPDNEKNILLQARLYLMQKDNEAALGVMQKSVQEFPENVVLRNYYARLLIQENRAEEALDQYQILITMGDEEQKAQSRYTLALLLVDLKQHEKAREQFRRLVKSRHFVNESNYYIALTYQMDDEKEKALPVFKKVERGTEYWMDAQYHIGEILADIKGPSEALNFLESLDLKTDVERRTIARLEARLLRQEGRIEDAIEIFDRLLEKSPDDIDLKYAKAVMMADDTSTEVSRVEAIFLEILKIRPDDAHTLNALGYTLADRTDRYEEALGYIQRAYELQPKNLAILDSMGWVHYRLGHYKKALEFLRRAADADDPEISSHFGEVLWVNGDHDQARDVWGKALLKYPKNPVLLKTIEKYDHSH